MGWSSAGHVTEARAQPSLDHLSTAEVEHEPQVCAWGVRGDLSLGRAASDQEMLQIWSTFLRVAQVRTALPAQTLGEGNETGLPNPASTSTPASSPFMPPAGQQTQPPAHLFSSNIRLLKALQGSDSTRSSLHLPTSPPG